MLSYILQKYFAIYKGIDRECWRSLIYYFFNSISIGICFFISLYFIKFLNFTVLQSGILMSFYGAGTILGGIVAGKLCDLLGENIVLVASLTMQSISFFILSSINSLAILMPSMLILGIATYGFKTANYSRLLTRSNGNMQLRMLNISNVAANLGLGVSGIIMGTIKFETYQYFFIASAALILAMAIYEISSTISSNKTIPNEDLNSSGNNGNKSILLFSLISIFLVGLIVAQLSSTYPLYISDTFPKLGKKAVSVLFMLDTCIIILCQAPLSALYGRYNTILMMGVGALTMGAGMLILSLSNSFSYALLSCMVWTTGEMIFFPTAQLLCYQNGGGEKKGQTIGLYQSSFALSLVAGPTIGSYLYAFLNHNAMWYLSMMIGIACFTISIMFYQNTKINRMLITDTYASS